MKKYLLTTLLVCLGINVMAQQDEYERMPYVLGDILVMVDDNDNIQQVVESSRKVNGVMTELTLVKSISEPTNIWLLQFDHTSISHLQMLGALYENEHVVICQNNHLVEERATTPNDTQFGSQWQHQNIESELAWDITTGGATANGDDIVVAVLEGGGADWDHPDLINNHWVNTGETDGNGIDDDGNGYIDDYHGWNLGTNSDAVAGGNHGTAVSGMIGAEGDNNNQVVGANWDVKIMQVDMSGGLSESNVIAAYTYPMVLREMYNNSGGAEGAFVVATNASWGIDGGDPASAPMWCAFYDSLGQRGILNFGATANNPSDIDVVGDLPTACGSDYMISVTATNSSDQLTFAAYGATTIDLGAPGDGIFTTENTNSTGSTSGTSFATPFTAGVCALMYSVPCSDIATLALTNPQDIADSMRVALLSSVDPVSSLAGITVTGGRLNAYNSVLKIQTDCGNYSTNCTGSFSGAETAVSGCAGDCNGEINMTSSGGSGSYQYSIDGGSNWQSSPSFNNLCAGNYLVSVDDGVDCQQNVPVSVTEPASVNGTINTTGVSCNGDTDGSISITGTGGNPPYTYSIDGGSNFQSSGSFTNQPAGTVSVVVQDDNGCEYTTNATVNAPSLINTSVAGTTNDSGMGDGSINITVSGGSFPYSFSWTGPNGFTSTDEDPTGLEAGIYTCIVTDANGCTVSSSDIEIFSTASLDDNAVVYSMYPNPADDELIIQLSDQENVLFELRDNAGRLVMQQQLIDNNTVIDIESLAAGVYVVRLTNNEGFFSTTKLVVE